MEADQDISQPENESRKAPRSLDSARDKHDRGAFSSVSNDRSYIMLGLRIAGDFGVTLAAPIVVFVLIGRWLDGKYDSNPWFTVAAFVLAAVLSGILIYRKAKRYGQEYNNLDKKEGEKVG